MFLVVITTLPISITNITRSADRSDYIISTSGIFENSLVADLAIGINFIDGAGNEYNERTITFEAK